MGKVWSMSWGKDGVPKTSKNAPLALQQLVDDGHFRQEPLMEKKKKTEQSTDAFVPEKFNPNKVATGQVWKDLDERNRSTVTQELRVVKVICLAESEKGYKALVENIATHNRSFVLLPNFKPRGKRGYKLVNS